MSGVVRVKEGVQFGVIAPGGFAILAAIVGAATRLAMDLTITSGSDGAHSGVDDPHHRGEAYDLRSHDLTVVWIVHAAVRSVPARSDRQVHRQPCGRPIAARIANPPGAIAPNSTPSFARTRHSLARPQRQHASQCLICRQMRLPMERLIATPRLQPLAALRAPAA